MDYKELATAVKLCGNEPNAALCEKCPYWSGLDMSKCIPRMTADAATAITDLLARAEAAEARAEKAERERDAAVKELNEVAEAVDGLSDFIDEQVHPLVSYDIYTALRENADAISVWQYESEWRGQEEE